MIKEVILATGNEGKVREFKILLAHVVERLISLNELNSVPEIIEDGNTFRENALKKARIVCGASGKIALADDSGLEVAALGGRPGVYSARYAGENAKAGDNIKKLLDELCRGDPAGRPCEDRKARFICCLALVFPDGREIVAEGTCEGVITEKPAGKGGFGYDPVFSVPAMNRTMAELTAEEKNLISHRSRAVKALIDKIQDAGCMMQDKGLK